MNDEQEIPFRLNVVYSRQSRYGGGSFSSCDAQYAIRADTATSLGLPVHDHFADEVESSETLDRPLWQHGTLDDDASPEINFQSHVSR
ncbi:hypothetical protein [Stieleria varia]|uniref:hypothetical protein n=1 Tax=Stieleria varia TaxID=2528005 RepID=UPI0018D213FA|nr:hypothetical protein [Stieleria varia]